MSMAGLEEKIFLEKLLRLCEGKMKRKLDFVISEDDYNQVLKYYHDKTDKDFC